MAYPWDVLGIEPTPDAGAIRRAYARALKSCRPDEDAEGFQRLVEARARALAWRWPDPAGEPDDDEEPDAGGGLVVRLTEAQFAALLDGTAPMPGHGDAHEPGQFDPVPLTGAPLRGEGEASRLHLGGPEFTARTGGPEADPDRERADKPGEFDPVPLTKPLAGQREEFARLHLGEAEFAARQAEDGRRAGFGPLVAFQPGEPDRLTRLLRQMAGLLRGSDVRWDGGGWRGLVRDAGELDLSQRKRLRDAVIRDALARLPAVPPYERVRDDVFADRGPAAAVDVLEAEFAFSRDQAQLAGSLGQAPTLRYLGWLEHARRELPPSRRTPGQQRALALVAKLTGADGAMNHPVRSAWRVEDCQEFLALVAGMAPGEREPCIAALLHELGARLPATTDEAVWMYSSIAAAVEALEGALQFEGAGRDAVPAGAVLPPQYGAWVVAGSRLRAAQERRERGAYRDAHGIPVLPPEDADTGIWAHPRFGEYWAEARRRGRWPVRFDWQACLFPLTELSALGVAPGWGLALIVVAWLGTIWAAELVADGPAEHWIATSCLALFIVARVPFAFLNRRAAVLLAMWRIRRADRNGKASPQSRAAGILAPTLGRQLYRRGFEVLFLFGVLSAASTALEPASRREEQFYKQGLDHAAQGRNAEAITAFDQALRLGPNDVQALYGRAVSQYARGYDEVALAGFSRIIELDPQKAEAYDYRAMILMRQKHFAEALPDADKANQLQPDDPRLLTNRAVIYGRLGDRAKEIEGCTAALAIAPGFTAALANRGRAFVASGEYGRGVADFTAVLNGPAGLTPAERASLQVARGQAYTDMGDFGLAVADLKAALAKYDAVSYQNAQRSLGYAEFYMGAFTYSAQVFDAVLGLRPEPYALLFWHLARARAGSADIQTLQKMANSVPKDWPYPVVQMFLGELAPNALLLAATKDNERCEAAFYVGEWQLLHGQPGLAAPLFRAAEAQCPRTFVEHQGAVAEFRRLPP